MGICGCKQMDAEPGQVTIHQKSKEDLSARKTDERDERLTIPPKNDEALESSHKQSTHIDNLNASHKVKAMGIPETAPVKEKEEIKYSYNDSPVYSNSVHENKLNVREKEEKVERAEINGNQVIHAVKVEKEEKRAVTPPRYDYKEKDVEEPAQRKKKPEKNVDKGEDSVEYDYPSDGYGGGEDEEDIEIENTYFEAEDKMNSRPKDAIEGFQTVIMLEENKDEKKYTFKSLLNIILIKCKLQLLTELSDDVSKILRAMDKVSKNDANDAINSILEALLNLEDQNQADKAIIKILDYLKEKNYEQLWLNASTRLCKIYLDRKEYTQFETLIETIKESCRLPDGSDDPKKSTVLLELYSLEINVYMQTMNIPKIKEIYEKTKKISSGIADPRTMGIIKETHGKMLMIDKDWENARLELWDAFKSHQEVGSMRAKNVLKDVVIASILAQSLVNPFDNVEAKVYREDGDIKVMDTLRTAYEKKDGKELIRIMGSQKYKIFNEQFIQQFEEDFMNVICLEMIVTLAAPYQRMKFEYLQRELNLSEKQVESYISKLILDRKLNGKIDLIDGFFENYNAKRNEVEERKNQALAHWIKSLSGVNAY